jgi:uncharacterized protein (AIM24 family)
MKNSKRSLVSKALLSFFLLSFLAGAAQAVNYNFKKTITIAAANVSGTAPLSNFPLLFEITDADLRTVANGGGVESANGYDILFLDENDQVLAHELVTYDASTGAIRAWVKLAKLYASLNTELQLVYGNTAVVSDPSLTSTWDSDYEAVLHLQESGNGSDNEYQDATSNNHHGTGGGLAGAGDASRTPTRVAGKFGFAQNFDDAGNQDLIRLDAVNDATWTGVTVEAWVSPDDNGDDRVFGKSWGTGTNEQTWLLRKTGGTAGTRMRTNTNNNTGFDPSPLNNGSWQHIAVSWDATTSELIVYRNGIAEGTTTLNGATLFTTPTADEPTIGNTTTLDRGFDGQMQEVRVSKVPRSADWMATQFTNQNNPSGFYTLGAEVNGPFTPVIPTCGYAFRKTITIDNTRVSGSGSHINFPVLVSFTDNDLRTTGNGGNVVNGNGYDIVFTDNALVPLDHQVETYNAVTGELVAWVKVPALPTGADYEINMLYGNAEVITNPSTSAVWATDFEGVWHLHDDVDDASGNGQNGINNGSADAVGKIGDAQDFDGTDFIELTSFPNLTTDFTVSAWINTTDRTQQGQRVFCDDELNTGGFSVSLGDGGAGRMRFYSRSMSNVIVDGTAVINDNTWQYITAIADRTTQQRLIYVNGVLVGSDLTDTGTWGTDNGDASIGGETASGETANRFEGRLDEVRVAGAVRSPGWIVTEFNNQDNPSTFYSVGAEEGLIARSTADGDWDQTGIWNTGAVPGLGATVSIESDVDLDDRDLYICRLNLDNSNIGGDAALQIQSSRTLRVKEDVNLIGAGGDDVILRVMGGNSKLIVEGDLYLDHDGGDDVFTDVEDGGDSLIVQGNFLIEHDGGDDIDIRVDNNTAVMLIEGEVMANMNSGTGDLIEFDLNSGRFVVNGKFTGNRLNDFQDFELDMDDGDFVADSVYLFSSGGSGSDRIMVLVDGNSTFSTNYFYLEMGGGDDHQLDVNVNAGTSATLLVNGDMDIVKSGGDDLHIRVDDANSLFHVTGNLTITSTGAEEIQLQLNSDAIFDVDGNMTVTHAEGELFHIFTQGSGSNPTLNVDGNLTINWNGGNDLFNPDLEGGNFNVGGNFVVNKNTGSGFIWFDCDGGNVTVSDTFFANHVGDNQIFIDLDGGSIFTSGTFIGTLSGNSNAEELLIDVDEDCQFNVTGNMELEANTGNDIELHLGENTASTAQLNVGGNLTLDHNGSLGVDDIQFFLNDDAKATIGGVFTMETDGSVGGAGNFLCRLNDNAVLSVNSNLVLDNTTGSGFLEIELNDNALLQLGGNVVRNANPNNFGLIQSNSATTTIEYNGTGAQLFADEDGAGTDGIEYELVVINNTFGTEPQLSMESAVTLSNNITFTDGVLQTTSVNLLTIADNATSSGGNADSYVSGPLQKQGDDPFIFPLGKNGQWARLGISDLQNGPTPTDQFIAEYYLARHPQSFWDSNSYAGNTGGFFNVSIVEYWDLSRSAGTVQPKVTLYWEDGAASYIDNLPDLKVAHLTGPTTWTNQGGNTSGTVAAGSVTTTTNVSSFSPFAFGSTNPAVNPLPVELMYFNATPYGQTVLLNWETLTEINNDYYTVERSSDALLFEPIQQTQGAGTSTIRKVYHAIDNSPLMGTSYYRLKQTDFDGRFKYSDIVPVKFDESTPRSTVYPNPLSEEHTAFTISGIEKDAEIQMYSITGRRVPVVVQKYEGVWKVQLEKRLQAGMYVIKLIRLNEKVTVHKLIVH